MRAQPVATFNVKLTAWLVEYDFHRLHAALGYRRPIEILGAHSDVLLDQPVTYSELRCTSLSGTLELLPSL
jgi:hypothetical protein